MGEREISGEVDLFGDPIIVREAKRGRPEHVRTRENANKVSLMFALGHSIADVAATIGVTQPTLRKHYFSECERRRVADLRLEADQLNRLHAASTEGNVAASKALMDRLDKARLATRAKAQQSAAPSKKAPALGKKEQLAQDAKRVEGRFQRPEAPLLTH